MLLGLVHINMGQMSQPDILPQRNPLVLAKQVASLDVLSTGSSCSHLRPQTGRSRRSRRAPRPSPACKNKAMPSLATGWQSPESTDGAWASVPGPLAAHRRATMTAPASAASTTIITDGSSTTRRDCAQSAARLFSVSAAKAANATTPAPSQAARAAGFDSQMLCSGIPAFNGTRAPVGSVRAAYPAAATIPSSNTAPTASAATTGWSLEPSCLPRYPENASGEEKPQGRKNENEMDQPTNWQRASGLPQRAQEHVPPHGEQEVHHDEETQTTSVPQNGKTSVCCLNKSIASSYRRPQPSICHRAQRASFDLKLNAHQVEGDRTAWTRGTGGRTGRCRRPLRGRPLAGGPDAYVGRKQRHRRSIWSAGKRLLPEKQGYSDLRSNGRRSCAQDYSTP